MITFPRSRILEFYRADPDWKAQGKRLGQAFYDYMQLEKVVNADDKAVCEKLYQANSGEATKIIIAHTDWEN